MQEDDTILTYSQLKDRERVNVLQALRHSRWKISGPGGAAELLDLNPTTLISRINKMGIKKPH